MLAPICVEKFQHQADAATILIEFNKVSSWKRRSIIEKRGWATMPGTDTPNSAVASAWPLRPRKFWLRTKQPLDRKSPIQVRCEPVSRTRPSDDARAAAAARVHIIVCCRDCSHQVESDPSDLATRYGEATSVPDWRVGPARLSRCGSRSVAIVVTGARRRDGD